VGEEIEVLIEEKGDWDTVGRAAHQGPDVDGTTSMIRRAKVGELVRAVVLESEGVDLVARPL
jgi:hypothetical protein